MPASSSTGSSLFNGAKRKASLGNEGFLLPTFLCALIWDFWVRGKNRPLFLSELVEQMSKSIASRGSWAADFRARWRVTSVRTTIPEKNERAYLKSVLYRLSFENFFSGFRPFILPLSFASGEEHEARQPRSQGDG